MILPINLPPVVLIIIVNPELHTPRFKLAGNIFASKAESTLSKILHDTNKTL